MFEELRNLEGSSTQAKSRSPRALTKRALSVRPSVPLAFGNSEKIWALGKHGDKSEHRIIGLGSCGTIFESSGTKFAIKKGDNVKATWTDFLLTNRAYTALLDACDILQDAFPERTIPHSVRCSEFWLPDSKVYWDANLENFPPSHRARSAAFHMDRIPPLSRPIREALIDLYFDDSEEIQEEAKNDLDNKDCLVRIYLGERETPKQATGCYDSLRNFPMRLNMVEDLKLDKSAFAAEMAIGLAVIHWQAQIDAMDIEFVLGSAAATPCERRRKPFIGNSLSKDLPPPTEVNRPIYFTERTTHCWILDFDKASHFELTNKDVEKKLVPAFLGNDPYYPRPDVDEELWTEFCSVYLLASKLILDRNPESSPTVSSLPLCFLSKVQEMIKENEGWDPEEHIIFGE